ncbi:MAG: molybdopterin molybdotransferase MoeA [Candidatus Eremiobacteraeota bacterium]|nr:molybdopterin molybdotransferase MoeA [Candidatus Eremiobacteraeota bacterium]
MRPTQTLLPGQGFDPSELLAPSQAILAYTARVPLAPLGVETVGLDAAFGRVLARDAIADAPYPAHPRSAMDGFAVRAEDGVGPRAIVGEVRMGHAPPGAVGSGQAMRIPTGGAVPEGADSVVPVEDADERDGSVVPGEAPQRGYAITPTGEDMRRGDLILRAGIRLDARALGVLATLGITAIPVWRRPRVAIISTGDELIDPDKVPGPGQIRDSNRYGIAAALRGVGAEPVHHPRALDDPAKLEAAIERARAESDAIVLSGGSSVGVRDLVPRAIDRLGKPGVVVHGLRVRPGKPTVLAALDEKPVIGLPGNPMSALMIFRTIAEPIFRRLTGEAEPRGVPAFARAATALVGRPGWTWFVPVNVEIDGVERKIKQLPIRSSHTSLLARADGFVIIPEDRPRIEAGEAIEVHPFLQ